MDNSDQDYLTEYRLFFDNIFKSLDLVGDPLPVHIGKYNVAEFEIAGEIICWCLEYLNIRKCPPSLLALLCRSTICEMQDVIRRDPESCGYRQEEDDYQTLRLMQMVIRKLNEVCLRYRDNSELSKLPPPPPVPPSISAAAVKNGRRTMEDCHIIIHDLHALFGIQGYGVASYYAVFDGHIGSDAALYSCSHVYQYLVESPHYPSNPVAAFKEAYTKTDERFIDKSNKENLKSGTTAVSVLIRHDLGKLYVAWLGDSQAILVNGRDFIQLVNPHRPEQLEERLRIEKMGGSVVYWGTWRVNGQLAVSRAIGDVDYKPYVTADADVHSYDLTGDEDFLLLACDGLWDVLSEKEVIDEVYKCIEKHQGDRSQVSSSLVQAAKSLGSKDNISVVVAWLDMSTLENGHFPTAAVETAVPGDVPDSADELLPPILRSLKPAISQAPQRLDEKAESWLKTLPWSYADAVRKQPPKVDPPPALPEPPKPVEKVVPVKEETPVEEIKPAEPQVPEKSEPPVKSPKGEELVADVGEGDSGDDSDEEWNYVSGKENRQPNQHSKQELSEEDMESQLNPDAAEFVPTFGSKSPVPGDSDSDVDVADIAHSPTKQSELRTLEGVKIPSAKEFMCEIKKRPSDVDPFNDTEKFNGDLKNVSTKALFGDESGCLDATVDSSIIQNESLKNTNPFASSQVPNFVQDHFSDDFGFKPLNDSKDNFDLMGNGFGEKSKQDDSPLLCESPELGLHNGQAESNPSSPNVQVELGFIPVCVNIHVDESKLIEMEEEDEIEKEPSITESPSPPPQAEPVVDLPPLFPVPSQEPEKPSPEPTPVLNADTGPETCVDSESEDDISPSKKESNLAFEENFTKNLVDGALKGETSLTDEPVGSDENNGPHDIMSQSEEMVIVGMSPESFLKTCSEHVEIAQKESNNDLLGDYLSDIVKKEEEDLVHVSYEATPMSAEQVVIGQSPLPVEEVCVKQEFHEGTIIHEKDTKDETDKHHLENGFDVSVVGHTEEKKLMDDIELVKDSVVPLDEVNESSHIVEDVCYLKSEASPICDKKDNVSKDHEESVLVEEKLQPVCPPLKEEEEIVCQLNKSNDFAFSSNETGAHSPEAEEDRPPSPADFSKIGQNLTSHIKEENIFDSEYERKEEPVCQKSFNEAFSALTENEVCAFKTEANKVEEVAAISKNDDNCMQHEDEMSSSMIDHGEEKSLPEAQSNQLNLVQDLQFDVQEKNEADTESDSGFEIINASEASTVEMEMRFQSEKEAGAVDEKLLLDRNEAEVEGEKPTPEVKEEVQAKVIVEEEKVPEAVLNGGTVTPPATPPATPAPGLQDRDSKEGLIAAVVAAAGIATATAGATAAVATAETKIDEKKKPLSPKKAEPTAKGTVTAKPTTTKPTASKTTAPAKTAATKSPVTAAKSPTKPTTPIAKATTASARPGSATSKPSTPTSKVGAAKPLNKPSTPTTTKAPVSSTAAATKSKPLTTSATGKLTGTAAKPAAAKPAAPKPGTPTSSTATKPVGTSAKPTAPATKPSTTASRPATKPATAATTAAKAAPTRPPVTKAPVTKSAATSTAPKAPASSARPTSATKTTMASKPLVSSTAAKAPAKPAAASATKPAATRPASTATKAPATKAPAKPAPAKAAPAAPLNKKPAAPTAIKKPAAPNDKSVKETNNKLASAKTVAKKVDDKKVINKKEEIIENVEPLTQEPIISTTNGHISLIENSIPTHEIAAEVN